MGGSRIGNAPDGKRCLVLTFDRKEPQDQRQPRRDSGESKRVDQDEPGEDGA